MQEEAPHTLMHDVPSFPSSSSSEGCSCSHITSPSVPPAAFGQASAAALLGKSSLGQLSPGNCSCACTGLEHQAGVHKSRSVSEAESR